METPMDSKSTIKFHQLLELQLNKRIQKYQREPLTHVTMRAIREDIRDLISSTFSKSRFKLSTNATTWLTDQYFKAIRVNEEQTMAEQVAINEYKLSELDFNDIQLLRNLFNETTLSPELEAEFRRRSVS